MTRKESRQLVKFLLAAWNTQCSRLTEDDIVALDAAYSAGLIDLDFKLAEGALGRLVRTSRYLPTVAEIRASAGVLVHGPQQTGAEAWESVSKAMRTMGFYRSPGMDFEFSDPIAARVVKALGWGELCRSDNAIADRARFIDAYEQITKQERTEAQAASGAISKVLPIRGAATPIGELARRVLEAAKEPSEP